MRQIFGGAPRKITRTIVKSTAQHKEETNIGLTDILIVQYVDEQEKEVERDS